MRSTETMINLYKTMVRPHLEYCVSAWSPHYIKDKLYFWRRCSTDLQDYCLLFGPYHMRIERLHQLRLWTLEERRNRADLIGVFKMAHGLSAISLGVIPWSWSSIDVTKMWRSTFSHSGLFQSGICWTICSVPPSGGVGRPVRSHAKIYWAHY